MSKKKLLVDAALVVVSIFALATAAMSLSWPVVRDMPILLYEGFLIHDLGFVPYRDFYELNPPGTMLLASFLHQATGGAAAAVHLLDLLVLAATGAFTALALGEHGRRAGILAVATYASLYFTSGPASVLQREYLCVLPLAISLALVFRRHDIFRGQLYPLGLAGAMAGMVATVKPPLILCWLPLFAYDAWLTWRGGEPERRQRLLRSAAVAAAGGLAPLLLVVIWLAANQALFPFLEMARNYYPLYTQIDGGGTVLRDGGLERLGLLGLQSVPLLAGAGAILALAGLATGWNLEDPRLRAQNAVFAGLVLTSAAYVAVTGKFWLYHRIPVSYAFAVAAAILLSKELPARLKTSRGRALTLAVALIATLPIEGMRLQLSMWGDPVATRLRTGQAAEMAAYLRENGTPDDTILPLDTVTGALGALYQVKRPLYGYFVYDYHFYHHGSSPYIAGLRRRMLAQFGDGKPSLLLKCSSWRPQDTPAEASFPELDAIVRDQYVEVLNANDCAILRHR